MFLETPLLNVTCELTGQDRRDIRVTEKVFSGIFKEINQYSQNLFSNMEN